MNKNSIILIFDFSVAHLKWRILKDTLHISLNLHDVCQFFRNSSSEKNYIFFVDDYKLPTVPLVDKSRFELWIFRWFLYCSKLIVLVLLHRYLLPIFFLSYYTTSFNRNLNLLSIECQVKGKKVKVRRVINVIVVFYLK